MTDQEIFDKVATHLLSQGERSALGGVGCAYRGDGGLRCAIGCLIPDEFYRYELEGWGAVSGIVCGVLRQVFGQGVGWQRQSLLGGLQSVHDNCYLEGWRITLCGIAVAHGLSPLACGPLLSSVER